MRISILGNGACGTAFNIHLSRLGHIVFFDKIDNSEIIFVCVPSYAVISVLSDLQKNITNQKIVICSKGFASGEKLLSETVKEKFSNEIFFLYGPSLAKELEKGELTGMVLAGDKGKEKLKKEIESTNLRIELSDDVIGVQIGAALKNVVTIFVGIADGAGYGENTQAFILTKGLQEIQKFGVALGANSNTFLGLTCVGDLMLHSRNRILGISLGKGQKLKEIIKNIHVKHILEGITTTKNVVSIAKKNGIKIPFIETLYSVIFENLPIEKAIQKIK